MLNEILPGNNKNVLYLICKYKAICYACLSRYKESIKYYILAGRANPNYSDYLLIKIKFLLGIIGEEIEGLKPGFFPFSIIQNFTKISIKPNYLFSNGREQKTVIHNDFTETLHQDAIPLNQILFTFQNKRLSFLSKNLIYLNKGLAYADKLTSAIFNKEKLLLENISTGGYNLLINNPILDNCLYLNGRVAFLSSRWGSSAYYHWLFDVLPRLELLRAEEAFENIDYFVFHNPTSKFNVESLKRLEIPEDKIIDSKEHPVILADELIIPSIIDKGRGEPWVKTFLWKTFLNSNSRNPEFSERIYITRKKKRRLLEEETLLSNLTTIGFQTIALEDYSICQQAKILNGAKVIVAPHGAGLSNIIFCKPSTILIEIFSPLYVNSCFYHLSCTNNLEYYYYVGEHYQDKAITRNLKQDIKIDTTELFNYVESIIKKNGG